MKRMEYIERRENLEAEIKKLRRKEEELDKMQSECKHKRQYYFFVQMKSIK